MIEEVNMSQPIFLATTGSGIARAVQNWKGEYSVDAPLQCTDARCLAGDPLNSKIIYTGTQGEGVLMGVITMILRLGSSSRDFQGQAAVVSKGD